MTANGPCRIELETQAPHGRCNQAAGELFSDRRIWQPFPEISRAEGSLEEYVDLHLLPIIEGHQ